MEDFVKLENITKVHKMGEVEIRAADNINFSIKKGEFVVIVGPSVAGKTTVLNISRHSSRAESSREFLSQGRLQRIPSFCSATSPPVPWITIREKPSSSSCRICAGSGA